MKKINWKIWLAVGGLIVVAIFLLLYKIGDQYMWTDEVYSFHAAKMILEKGQPLYDSGLYYGRATVYNYLLAWSMKLFGENEFGSRIINIPFVIGTMLLCFFFVKDILRKNKNNIILGLGAALLYLTTNFTIACVRETRMYAMTVFLVTLAAISFYYCFISKRNTKILNIFKLQFRYNIPWLITFVISFFLAYKTQAISILLGVGMIIFFIIQFIIEHKKENLIFVSLITIVGLIAIYDQYHTLNLYQVFLALSPEWATGAPVITYYPLLLVRNFSSSFILSPLIILSAFKYRKKLDIYLLSLFVSYIVFISLQKAQHERYLEPILPLLPMMLVISLTRLFSFLKKKSNVRKIVLIIGIVLIIAIPKIYLLQKELKEIDTYTKTSLSIHKKMQFNGVFDYLNTKDLTNTIVIADFHSAYTLYEKGYKVDYILVTDTQYALDNGKDIYFGIKYLSYDQFRQKARLIGDKIVIVRDYDSFPDIENYVSRYTDFQEPRLYK